MAVAFDSYSRGADGYNSSCTVSHTCTGADLYLLVYSRTSKSSNHYTGCTYGGVAMTELLVASSAAPFTHIVYGLAVSAGTANIVLSSNTGDDQFDMHAMSFTGVGSAGTPISADDGSYSSSPNQQAITIAANGMGASFISSSTDKSNTFSPESGQTLAYQSDSTLCLIAGGYKPGSATTLGWTWTGGGNKASGRMSIALASAGGGLTLTPSLFTNTNTFYAPTVTPGAVTLTPSLFTNDNTFYSATVSLDGGAQTLTPALFSNSNTFHAATMARVPGFLTPILKNNAGTVLANETGVVCNVYNTSTGALVVRKTGLTSSAAGIVSVTDAAMAAGTTYSYEIVLTGARRLPVAAA